MARASSTRTPSWSRRPPTSARFPPSPPTPSSSEAGPPSRLPGLLPATTRASRSRPIQAASPAPPAPRTWAPVIGNNVFKDPTSLPLAWGQNTITPTVSSQGSSVSLPPITVTSRTFGNKMIDFPSFYAVTGPSGTPCRADGQQRMGQVMAVGDFNCDGYQDLAVSAPVRQHSTPTSNQGNQDGGGLHLLRLEPRASSPRPRPRPTRSTLRLPCWSCGPTWASVPAPCILATRLPPATSTATPTQLTAKPATISPSEPGHEPGRGLGFLRLHAWASNPRAPRSRGPNGRVLGQLLLAASDHSSGRLLCPGAAVRWNRKYRDRKTPPARGRRHL